MSIINIIFKRIGYIFGIILVLELFILASFIDVLPFFFMAFICGVLIAIRHRSEGNINDLYFFKSDTWSIIFTLFLCFITLIIGFVYIFFGISNIANNIISLLNSSIYFRFFIYGIVFPVINIFFMNWCYTGISPLEHISVDVCTIIAILNLFIGLLLCMHWESYYAIAEFILSLV